MKDIIKNMLADSIKKTYEDDKFVELIEVQNVTAKNIKADYFTNISMKLAKELKINPIKIADKIVKNLSSFNDVQVDIVKPGYINFLVEDIKKNNIISLINESDDLLQNCKTEKKLRINVEFVSANPTGPLHIGHGRGVIYGNIIAKFLIIQGHNVTKEYYVNDHGNQIRKLCLSILSHIDENYSEYEDDLYQGVYTKEIALLLEKNNIKLPDIPESLDGARSSTSHINIPNETRDFIVKNMIKKIKDQLDKLDVEFDNWFYETSLFDKTNKYKPEDLITELRKSDDIYDDGTDAILLKAEEPRVLVKSDGTYTYFATDLAYHYLKLKKYDRVIDIWGADHHGYIPRMEAGLKALGHDINKLDIHLIQFANLFRDGEKISMSTRKGQYVELDQLSDEIGKDAINFFYLTKNKDQHLDFDLDIAIKQNKNNPVYYIQYAHARIEKILNEVDDYKSKEYDFSSLNHELEKELISTLIKFEEVSKKTIMDLQPQLMTHYLQKLAQCFHSYYANIKILNDGKADYSKVHLIAAVQKVIKCGLDLLNINSPKVM
ncbi:MAG: arginine--tRNA ligase [Pseudomonadota bacterium]|nr:arginine--tRNA ligase [Pseudomonadota bacterium]